MKQLYNPENGVMKVAAFMSGSGTNIRRLYELEQKLNQEGKSSFELVAIVTDTPDEFECNALGLAREFNLEYFASDINIFYQAGGLDRKKLPLEEKLQVLQDYYLPFDAFLKSVGVACNAHGGYMNIVAEPLLSNYINVNVHPADLRVVDESGKRKYTGDNAVLKAILAGEEYIRTSTHLMTAEVDGGPVVLVSEPLKVDLQGMVLNYVMADRDFAPKVANHNQNKLKEIGDWIIFPKTIQLLAEGRLFLDEGKVVVK